MSADLVLEVLVPLSVAVSLLTIAAAEFLDTLVERQRRGIAVPRCKPLRALRQALAKAG